MSFIKDCVMLKVAETLANLSTCRRRAVGCVLVDPRYRIIGSGYNGVPTGFPHCTESPCPLHQNPHGSSCFATHAEANAIAQCRDVDSVQTCFTTSFPCIECAKLLMNTSCTRVVYLEDYPAHRHMVEQLNAAATIAFHSASELGPSQRR